MVKYEEALKKPFTDLGRLILGIIFSGIPIVNLISQGFILECSGLGKNKPSKKLPEWKKFGDLFVKGLISYIIIFIYMIPSMIVLTVAMGYAATSILPVLVGVMPEGFMSSLMAGQISTMELRTALSENIVFLLPSLITVGLATLPLVLLGLVLLFTSVFLSPIAVLNYLKNKKFAKAFDFSFVITKALTGKYFLGWVVAGVIAIVLKLVLSPIPWIGPALAIFISGVIAYSLFGQIYRER